jgi:hypothetical protein
LGKKWQEIEFLDYKERQIRRRSQRTRAFHAQIEQSRSSTRGLKVVAVLAFLLVGFVGSYVLMQERFKALQAALFGGRNILTVVEVIKEVDIGGSTMAARPLKVGDTLKDEVTITLGEGARCTLTTFWKGSRIVLLDKGSIDIGKVVPVKENPDAYFVKVGGRSGSVMFEFRTGEPRVEVKTPQGPIGRGSLGFYRYSLDDKESSVLVRDGMVVVSPFDGADKSKKVRVLSDQRLAISKGAELDKPVPYATPDTVWK